MNNVITEYHKWKQQGRDLRTQAKQAMEARFRELLTEAVQLAEEYRADFGAPLKPSSPVTAFRYKAAGKPKVKKGGERKPAAKPVAVEPRVEPPPAKTNRRVAGLRKRLATTTKKLDAAKSAGSPTRNLEDRIYEIEDELRLAGEV